MMKIGQRIKALRAQQGITQTILAKRAGLTLAYIGRLETGHYDPQLSTLMKIAKALKLKIGVLLEP